MDPKFEKILTNIFAVVILLAICWCILCACVSCGTRAFAAELPMMTELFGANTEIIKSL